MTQNQIRYWELQETMRSNRVKERETHRSNKANEDIGFGGLAENIRSHLVSEQLKGQELEEIARHNVATEDETIRSHKTDEAERRRHNVETEGIGWADVGIRSREAEIKQQEADTHAAALGETRRHNVADEAFTGARVSTERASLLETKRHQKVEEGIKQYQAEEGARHNKASEDIETYKSKTGRYEVREKERHNVQEEALRDREIKAGIGTGLGGSLLRGIFQVVTNTYGNSQPGRSNI